MSNGTGQAVSGFFEAMKSQPALLGSLMCNLGLLAFLYYEGVQAHTERQFEMKLLYENRTFVGKLLAECNTSPRTDREERR